MDERRGRLSRAWLTLGHFSNHTAAVASLTGAAAILVWTAFGVGRIFLFAIVLTVYAVNVVTSVAERVHYRSLCPREVSEAPWLDPQGAVDRHQRELRVWHSRWQRIIPSVISMAFLVLYLTIPVGKEWAFVAMFAASGLGSAYLTYVDITHTRLYPWCPQCRKGGRGPRGFTVPDPNDPSGVRPNPVTA